MQLKTLLIRQISLEQNKIFVVSNRVPLAWGIKYSTINYGPKSQAQSVTVLVSEPTDYCPLILACKAHTRRGGGRGGLVGVKRLYL